MNIILEALNVIFLREREREKDRERQRQRVNYAAGRRTKRMTEEVGYINVQHLLLGRGLRYPRCRQMASWLLQRKVSTDKVKEDRCSEE